MSVIRRCTCSHEGQDKLYGKGLRVFNLINSVGEEKGRCTVCGEIERV